jgi:hypothetical protein
MEVDGASEGDDSAETNTAASANLRIVSSCRILFRRLR